jgi:hypothetical protein
MEQGQQWKWDKDNLTSPSSIAKNIVPGTGNYIKNEMLEKLKNHRDEYLTIFNESEE